MDTQPGQHLLAFVKDKEHDLVSLHVDLAGLDYFISQLQHIRTKLSQHKVEHTHLFSKEWGDGSLSVSRLGAQPDDGVPIHQVNVYGWTDNLVAEMGFEHS